MNAEVKKLPYWDKLSNAEKEFIQQNSITRTFEKGEFLKSRTDACLGMIHVIKGTIRTLMISEEGREITLFRLNAGDSCVLSASCALSQISFDTEMVATESAQVLIVDSGAYSELMSENIAVRCFSYELATERSSSVIRALQQIIFDKFDQRLARFLITACEESASDEIVMTKEAIAHEVNTAREVVSRTLKYFADEGLIQMNQKTIKIIDKEGLQNKI